MKKVSSYMGFSCGEKVYFYQDSVHPCVSGEIKKILLTKGENGASLHIHWDNTNIISVVPYEHVFKSEELCRAYSPSLRGDA